MLIGIPVQYSANVLGKPIPGNASIGMPKRRAGLGEMPI